LWLSIFSTQPTSWVWFGFQTQQIAFGPEISMHPSLPV
jgi:hypothetical protein